MPSELTIAGKTYSQRELLKVQRPIPGWKDSVQPVLKAWFDDKPYMEVKTSGSTGKPKTIRLEKKRMAAHARMTGNYFGLKPRDKALVCLPAEYIAGKMMIIRGIVLGLDLTFVEPTSRPLKGISEDFDFTAMIPLQVESSLEHDREAFERIKTVIIGGAPITYQLHERLKKCPNQLFATYGMTETITHVAVRDLKANDYFEPLPGVSLSQDARGCLVIRAPEIAEQEVVTNDLVELEGAKFKWLGRFDNVINTGGVKVVPENVERVLAPHIEQRFFIAGIPDDKLGRKVVLVVEGVLVDLEEISRKVDLPRHHFPKEVIPIPKFKETASGKVQREETLLSTNQ